jgi:hypothetical protein
MISNYAKKESNVIELEWRSYIYLIGMRLQEVGDAIIHNFLNFIHFYYIL